jgi:hypothetical protein
MVNEVNSLTALLPESLQVFFLGYMKTMLFQCALVLEIMQEERTGAWPVKEETKTEVRK